MWLRWHVEVAGDREQALKHSPDGNLLNRKAAYRFARGAERGRKFLNVVVRRDVLSFEVNFCDPPVVARDEAIEDLGKPDPGSPIDPAHDAKVYLRDSAIRQREQDAYM